MVFGSSRNMSVDDASLTPRTGLIVADDELCSDLRDAMEDIIRSSFYLVRTMVKKDSLIFPNSGSMTCIEWIVDADDYGLGDSLRHMLDTTRTYLPGSSSSTIRVIDHGFLARPSSLRSDNEVRQIWTTMQRIAPQEVSQNFDIVSWYEMMARSGY